MSRTSLVALIVVAAIALVVLLIAGCDPEETADPGDGECHLVGAQKSSGDSSIKVDDGTEGILSSGNQWCDIANPALAINPVSNLDGRLLDTGCPNNPNTSPPCPYTVLAGIDVKPDDATFAAPNANQPLLTYDAGSDASECSAAGACVVYQLAPGNKWIPVGDASQVGDSKLVEGHMDHFSILALVLLPEPDQVLGSVGPLTVVSPWMSDDTGPVSVSLRSAVEYPLVENVFEGDSRTIEGGEERIYRIRLLDRSFDRSGIPDDCALRDDLGELMTCAFPEDSELAIDANGDVVAVEGESFVEFRANLVVH